MSWLWLEDFVCVCPVSFLAERIGEREERERERKDSIEGQKRTAPRRAGRWRPAV